MVITQQVFQSLESYAQLFYSRLRMSAIDYNTGNMKCPPRLTFKSTTHVYKYNYPKRYSIDGLELII